MGISTWVYEKLQVESALRKLAAAGFKTLELYCDLTHIDPRIFPKDRLEEVRELADSLNLNLRTMHSPYNNLDLMSVEASKRDEAVTWAYRSLEYAQSLDCRFMVLHLGLRESAEVKGSLSPYQRESHRNGEESLYQSGGSWHQNLAGKSYSTRQSSLRLPGLGPN